MKMSISNGRCVFALLFLLPLSSKAQTNTNLGNAAGNAGTGNTSLGYVAGDVVTGNDNVFIGYVTGRQVTSGAANCLIGAYSGESMISGVDNVFLGFFSGRTAINTVNNTFIGNNTGYLTSTGNNNTFLGYKAGYSNNGSNNTNLGYLSGYSNSTGVSNVYIGTSAGYSATGSRNVFLGNNAGYNETGSDKLYIDNSNTATPLIYGDFNTNKVGINALPGAYTLNVGGTFNTTALYIGGVLFNPNSLWVASGSNLSFTQGIVSIGTATAPAGYKLAVGGKIVAEELVVKLQSNWPDYVFENSYQLPSLSEVEKFIKVNKHLPGVPDAKTVKEDGVAVGEMEAVLLKKVEELTLYVIELKKEIEALKK